MGGAVRFHIPHYAVKNLLGGKNKYQESSNIGPNMTPVPAEVWRLSGGGFRSHWGSR